MTPPAAPPARPVPVPATRGVPAMRRADWLGLGGVLLLGLGLRLIPLWAVTANGGSPLIGDEGNYVQAAQALAAGQGIPDLWIWVRPPGFIVFAAGIFRLTGDSLIALQLAQIALSLLTILAVYALVRWAAPGTADAGAARPAALLAAAVVAVQPSLVFSTALFLTETGFLLLLTGLVIALLRAEAATGTRARLVWAAGAGVCAGLALLTRASLIPLLGLVVLGLLWPRGAPRRVRFGPAAAFVVAVVLCLVPWTVRNAVHYGRFLPLDTAGDYVLWSDNSDMTQGDIHTALYAIPNLADRGSYALQQAGQWVLAHPAEFLGRMPGRLVDSLAPDDFTQLGYPVRDKLPGFPAWTRDLYSFGAWWGWVLLFGGALAGWIAARRDALWWLTAAVVGSYLLTTMVTHNEFRYRFPLFSLLAVYAAFAGLRLVRGLRARRRPGRPALLGAAAAAVWLVLALPTFLPGFGMAMAAQQALARAHGAQAAGDLPAAQTAYAAAADLDRTTAAIRRDLGAVQLALGQAQDAATTWAGALDREPGDWRTRALLADLWRTLGRADRSRDVTRGVPTVFNAAMQAWAWDHLTVTAPVSLTAGLDDIGLVRGFQIGEDGPEGRAYRWAGPGAELAIRLQGGQPHGATVTLVLNALPQTAPLPPARPVTVRAGGQVLTTLQVPPGWNTYTVALPATLTTGAPEVVMTFESPPQRASAQDPRALSFALHTASIAPAP